MEKLRDPSHVGALTLSALTQAFRQAGLVDPAVTPYRMTVELDAVLAASFPNPGDQALVRAMVLDSLTGDGMGVNTRRKGDKVYFSYPIAVLVSTLAPLA